jgi:hypothetical protein
MGMDTMKWVQSAADQHPIVVEAATDKCHVTMTSVKMD